MDDLAALEAAGFMDAAVRGVDGLKCYIASDSKTDAPVIAHAHAYFTGDALRLNDQLCASNAGVPRLIADIPAGDHALFVYESVQGLNVADMLGAAGGQLPLGTAAKIVSGLARAVSVCHANRVIIGTICPRLLSFEETSGTVFILDMPHAKRFGEVNVAPTAAPFLPYLAPEQTGRMDVTPGYSADVYCIGSLAYHLFTGRPPFLAPTGDAPDLAATATFVRQVLQDRPRTMWDLRADVSEALCSVVNKLLEKSPTERYQSAYGVWHDLCEINNAVKTASLSDFELAQHDVPCDLNTMRLSEGILDRERARLLAALDASVTSSSSVLICVTGEAGSGKSSLVQDALGFQRRIKHRSSSIASVSADAVTNMSRPFTGSGSRAGGSSMTTSVIFASSLPRRREADADDVSDAFQAPTIEDRAFRVSAKCSALNSRTPYFPIKTCLTSALKTLMSADNTIRRRFTDRVTVVLGSVLPVALSVLSQLRLLVKDTDVANPLDRFSTDESQNIVRQCLIDVLLCIAHVVPSFTVAIEDVQHADAGSLALLKHLLLQRCDRPFALILTVESNNPLHDVLSTLIESSAWPIHQIHVAPLDAAATTALAAHVSHIPAPVLSPHAAALCYHTKGNPAQVIGLLKSLFNDGSLMFDVNTGGWRIDDDHLIEMLRSLDHGEARLCAALQSLPKQVQYVLGISAALGTSCDVDVIASVAGLSIEDTLQALQSSLFLTIAVIEMLDGQGSVSSGEASSGIVSRRRRSITDASSDRTARPTSHLRFTFTHIGGLIACANLLSQADLFAVNFKKACLITSSLRSKQQLHDEMFPLLTRLMNCDLLSRESERPWFTFYAQLFYDAASDAIISSDAVNAKALSSFGLSILGIDAAAIACGSITHVDAASCRFDTVVVPDDSSVSCIGTCASLISVVPDVIRLLMMTYGSSLRFLCAFDEARSIFQFARSLCVSALEQSDFALVEIPLHAARGDPTQSIAVGLECLRELGSPSHWATVPPDADVFASVGVTLAAISAASGSESLDNFVNSLPVSTDVLKLRQHRVLSELMTPAFMLNPIIQLHLCCLLLEDVIAKASVSPYVAVAFSVIANPAGLFGQLDLMYELMKTAKALVKAMPDCRHAGRIWLYDVAFCSWRRNHPQDDQRSIEHGVVLCTSEGDLQHQLYCRAHTAVVLFWSPTELRKAIATVTPSMNVLKALPTMDSTSYLGLMLHDMHTLAGLACSFARGTLEQYFVDKNLKLGLLYNSVCTMRTQYLLGNLDTAFACIDSGFSVLSAAPGLLFGSMFHAWRGLVTAKLRLLRGASDVIDASLAACRPELAKLALDAPIMFAPLHALVEAELASQDPGTLHTAIELYDAAITSASQHRMTHYHALACELAGAFYLRCKSTHLGRRLIREAVGLYEAWGATAVAQRVRAEYAFLVSLSSPTAAPRSILKRVPDAIAIDAPASETTASLVAGNDIINTTSLSQAVDFDATVRFCQVLSRQHSLEDIMTEFKSIVKLCSGATGAAVVFADEIFPDGEVTDGVPQLFKRQPSDQSFESASTRLSVHQAGYPHSVVQYAAGSRDPVLLQYVLESEFAGDVYFRDGSHQSVLALPVFNNDKLLAVLYLEHDAVRGAFASSLLPVLNAISTQFSISYESLLNIERLIASKRHLEELSTVKDRFLATLSHELKTPLHSMSMCVGLLADSPLTPDQSSYVGILSSSAAVLQHLLTDLMDLSRMKSGGIAINPTPCSLTDLLLDVIGSIGPAAAKKDIELVLLKPSRLPKAALLDARRLKQVLADLLDNGIKFSASGGLVELIVDIACTEDTVTAAHTAPTDTTAPSEFLGSARLRFTVHDTTGPGISEELQSRLFQPFTQADTSDSRAYGGFGNGLARVKMIIEAMHGTVCIESNGVRGSQFIIDIPVTVLDQSDASIPDVDDVFTVISPTASFSKSAFAGRTVMSLCSRYSRSATVFGTYGRELGISVVHHHSMHELLNALSTFGARSSTDVIVLVDASDLSSNTAVINQLSEHSLVVLCLGHPGSPLFASAQSTPKNVVHFALPVLRARVLAALSEWCLPASSAVVPIVSASSRPPFSDRASPSLTLPSVPSMLPIRRHDAKPDSRSGSPHSSTECKHILIVEDNAVNAKLLRNLLRKSGFTSDIAENGAVGVDMARANPYAMILMDIQMPVMNGLDATRNIRQFNASIPIVAVTASVDDADRGSCLAAGMSDVMHKPVNAPKLMAAIREHTVAAAAAADTE